MASQPNVVDIVRKWCKIEQDIKNASKELKEKRQMKKDLSNELVAIMKSNDIDCFDITGGKILYSQNNVKKPITRQHLFASLSQLFTKTGASEEDINGTVDHIMNSREVKVNDNLRFKNTK